MDALALGPLVIPMDALLILLAILAAHGAAHWFHRQRGLDPGPALWKMILAGFIAARAVFVLRHRDIYASAPLEALDLRDGGLHATAGLLVALVVGAGLARRAPALRRPLLASALAGAALWLGATLMIHTLAPERPPLPDLLVMKLDGGEVPLRSFSGRPLVVNLWATWCPPCRREMPVLSRAQQANPDVGFVFVNQRESANAVRGYLDRHAFGMSNVMLDPPGRLAARTGSVGYPTTLFYDAAGVLRMRHVGELSDATLREKLGRLRKP